MKINRGILTGCNEAFIISESKKNEILSNCQSEQERELTAEIIRPILRGRDIKRYGYEWANLYVIVAAYGSHKYLQNDYPAVYAHLFQFKEKLEQRGQCRYTSNGKPNTNAPYPGQHHWLELDNNPRQEYLDDFSKQKIVWGNLALSASFSLAEDAIFVNAPSPMIVPGEKYLLAILNSKLADFYIRNLGVTRSGGYFEYKPMFVQEFPALKVHGKQKKQLEALIDSIMASNHEAVCNQLEEQIDTIVFNLYGLSVAEVEFIGSIL